MAKSNAILENWKQELNLIRLAKNYSYDEIMATDIGTKAQRKKLYGFSYLLSGSNPKVLKSLGYGCVNIICHLSPANSSGFQVCHMATCGCTKACLDTAGHGGIGDYQKSPVHKARIARTRLLHTHPKIFLKILIQDIEYWQNKADKLGMTLAIRLNGTSDVIWETRVPELFNWYKNIQWYDYTKYKSTQRKTIPGNYHLTYSRSEKTTTEDIKRELAHGRNVAVVFATSALLQEVIRTGYKGIEVIDATLHDLRYTDKVGVICGLYYKVASKIGAVVNEKSGFVVQANAI